MLYSRSILGKKRSRHLGEGLYFSYLGYFSHSLSHQSRGERHFSASFPASNRRSTVGSNYTNDHELTVIDNPDANGGKEIW